MPRSRFQVYAAVPGSATFGQIVKQFCANCRAHGTEGVVTSLSDALLPTCANFVDPDVAEVVPFGEVVRRYLRLCGEDAWALASGGHIEVAIARACSDLPDESPFARSARYAGLHQGLARTLKELHEWDIDRTEMRRIASLASPRLAEKMASIAAIDEFVDDVLERLRAQTHRAQVRACLDSMPELDGAYPALLVHVGADDSPLKLGWIRWAAAQGTRLTVVLERHVAEGAIFSGAVRASEFLGVRPLSTGDGNRLTRNLFAHEPTGGPPISVAVMSAVDPYAEAEWALRDCLAAIHPSQCGIYVRNLEMYGPLLETAGKRLGIPVTMRRRGSLLANAFARLTLAAIAFCASNDVRTLEPIVRSSYVGLTGETQTALRSGLRDAFRTRHAQWETLRQWSQTHRDEFPWLWELLAWRERAQENLRLREWKNLLSELLRPTDKFPWSLRVMDGRDLAERDRYARNQMERLLANYVTIEDLVESRDLSLLQMVGICRRIWDNAEVEIPAAEGGVVVADDPYRLPDVSTLRVMGMLEGVFPRRRSEDPILTDAERAEISSYRPDRPALPNSHDRAEAERDMFYRVCSAAQDRIVFSYPLADDARDNIPAFYLREVDRAMVGVGVERFDIPRNRFAPPEDACLAPGDLALARALGDPRDYPETIALRSTEAKSITRASASGAFEPRELQRVLQCPFRYAMRYRVRPQIRRVGDRWQNLAQLPKAAWLASHPDADQAERALTLALEAELDQLFSEVPAWELQLLRAGGRRLIREWRHREFVARELWPKEGLRQHVSFGSESLRSEMPGGVRLEGNVAAISRLQRYKVAHLYESGPANPKELTDTERLYLGLHFLALHESGFEGALEIESTRGRRDLLLLTRSGGNIGARVQDGLAVYDLGASDEPWLSKKEFFDAVKKLLREAVSRIAEGRIDPISGDHCQSCDYGELCRRAKDFGEAESPFDDFGDEM